ncbi:class I SAM-dependent methyltransferase [Oceanibacterium hippocampi]|uniref:Methyltransferase domain-containing protein n=1 Tax=Oceanibacterium hippocampi TaxID=745714 RepID=A0A1Y5R823_9PROT|nr:class I SAM-dependent methyltransferase [Oceanibacterium hippocampi]SLN10224.1 hypothetical protein OCH7691_00021 [Oceanibacterium hippocampi]
MSGNGRAGGISDWIGRFADEVEPGGAVLDVAAGGGRHTRFFTGRGHPVTAVDRDCSGLADLRRIAGLEIVEADLEAGSWPFAGRTFAAVIVANYLWRPLFPALAASVAPGGVVLYDTFAVGNERYGRPSNPDFLLRRGELLGALEDGFRLIAYRYGFVRHPKPAVKQQIAARRAP